MENPKQKYNFISLIKERIIDKTVTRIALSPDFAKNSIIELGDGFEVSVQASMFHYSTPRETFESNNDYSEFELAIFKDNNSIVVINKNISFYDYGIMALKDDSGTPFEIEELEHEKLYGVYCSNSDSTPLASYVGGEQIDVIIDLLRDVIVKLRSRVVLFEKVKKATFYSQNYSYFYKL